MFEIVFLPDAESSFRKLDSTARQRIADKLDWLAEHSDEIIHHPLTSLPDDLKGLCRMRAGDYRIIYWVYRELRLIKIYYIEHRSKEYRSIKR